MLADRYKESLTSFYKASDYAFMAAWNVLLVFVHFAFSAAFGLIYSLNHPFFEQFKSNTEPWPWESDPEQYKKDKRVMLNRELFYNCCLSPIAAMGGFALGIIRPSFDFYNLPSYSQHMLAFAFQFIFCDFWFYWVHRIAHTPKFYWIHKVHHECKNTTVWSALSVHWIEYIMVDMVVMFGGALILGPNVHMISA